MMNGDPMDADKYFATLKDRDAQISRLREELKNSREAFMILEKKNNELRIQRNQLLRTIRLMKKVVVEMQMMFPETNDTTEEG